MPTNPNMVAIQTVTVGSGGAASIEFTNIPQTYTDLVIKASLRDTRTDSPVTDVALTFNNSATGYSMRMIYGDGSSAGSASSSGASRITGFYENTNQTTSNTFSNIEIYIPNYTSSNNKSVSIDGVAENNATTIYSSLVAGLWADSSAITSIKLVPAVGSLSYAQYSTATLYGVTSAAVGAKATGGIISQDANYFYHTFVASGTFTPTANLSCDYLVVAGGGAGGASGGQSHGGGGGGAGGYRTSTGFSTLANTNYTVTVGAGGAGNTTTKGGDGSNSVFSTITSDGGGGGGYGVDAGTNRQGNNGGSGGGSGSSNSASIAGGTGTSGQGNNGGDSGPAGVGRAGSGGGASAASKYRKWWSRSIQWKRYYSICWWLWWFWNRNS